MTAAAVITAVPVVVAVIAVLAAAAAIPVAVLAAAAIPVAVLAALIATADVSTPHNLLPFTKAIGGPGHCFL